MTEFIAIIFSATNNEEAKLIGNSLVEERLAACLHIANDVHSTYWWHGKMEQGNESIATLKTRRALFDRICERIRKMHSNKIPEIIAYPIIEIDPDYANWLVRETE